MIADWKDGHHMLTYRQCEHLHGRVEAALREQAGAGRPRKRASRWAVHRRFAYKYRCAANGCLGNHEQTIVDWEVVTLWRRVRHRSDWQEAMTERFERQMWARRDSALFVGDMEQYPTSFLVLGVFWPPEGAIQGVLDFRSRDLPQGRTSATIVGCGVGSTAWATRGWR